MIIRTALANRRSPSKVRTVVLERHPAPPGFCRGFNLNARSLELFDRRGLADRFLAEGPTVPTTAFVGAAQLNLSAMRTAHPYTLGIAQTRVEEILAERAVELGVRILRGHRLTGLHQDADGVHAEVEATGGRMLLRPGCLVGCDGGRSTVRKLRTAAMSPSRCGSACNRYLSSRGRSPETEAGRSRVSTTRAARPSRSFPTESVITPASLPRRHPIGPRPLDPSRS